MFSTFVMIGFEFMTFIINGLVATFCPHLISRAGNEAYLACKLAGINFCECTILDILDLVSYGPESEPYDM